MKRTILVSLLVGACLTRVASGAWLRLPAPETEPVNLASSILIGTRVQSSTDISNPDALLANSSAEAATLPAGKSKAVISIGEQHMIDHVSFLNDGVAGKVAISASTDLKEWTPLAQATFSAVDRQVRADFAGAQGKYVLLAFDAATGSGIRSVKVGGAATMEDYKPVQVEAVKAMDVNLNATSLGAHAVYAFPTPANPGDAEDRDTFKFPRTTERHRTVVYDLGAVRTVKQFSAAYSRVPTRVQAFAFEHLPEKKDWRGKIALDPAIFDEAKPVATAEDARGEGSIQLAPERPVQARYVALRFEPEFNKRAGDGGDEFVVHDAAASGPLPLVLISRSAIAQMQLQPGAEPSEADAIHTILTATGFTAITNSTGPDGGSNAGLNALGSSAYRGGGDGGSGSIPFQAAKVAPPSAGNIERIRG